MAAGQETNNFVRDGSMLPHHVIDTTTTPNSWKPKVAAKLCTGPFHHSEYIPTYVMSAGPVSNVDILAWEYLSGWVTGGSFTAPNCESDISVIHELGNATAAVVRCNMLLAVEAQLLVNGAVVQNFPWASLHTWNVDYSDGNYGTRAVGSLGSAHFTELNVPAGANVEVQTRLRWTVRQTDATSFAQVTNFGAYRDTTFFATPREIMTGLV